ncbi:uncharacterized protein L969DRAFT_42906 [Mixia osmundae IAM 14324]|uniref:Uncharacterized protein n=1 Tax=Mixia osmundae (strain CBS 9802 / IAM 14324 / JCM 22182 / KY 12970) TaxID=764103 RepID=G7DV89_MIXOS|nr:uncharacterized protein L969DRAFT_42906 [Mixia osmundae IAM 14324]KEI42078.1 hypothetical protein L969DRAFT_42906 [Mixia osmundae IAM 14324]GAA94499.1 hypothetical protein E5Q_01151 [Mixia osmundae IAM 14324]
MRCKHERVPRVCCTSGCARLWRVPERICLEAGAMLQRRLLDIAHRFAKSQPAGCVADVSRTADRRVMRLWHRSREGAVPTTASRVCSSEITAQGKRGFGKRMRLSGTEATPMVGPCVRPPGGKLSKRARVGVRLASRSSCAVVACDWHEPILNNEKRAGKALLGREGAWAPAKSARSSQQSRMISIMTANTAAECRLPLFSRTRPRPQ